MLKNESEAGTSHLSVAMKIVLTYRAPEKLLGIRQESLHHALRTTLTRCLLPSPSARQNYFGNLELSEATMQPGPRLLRKDELHH